jgi:outer membrane protein OmpA-like peptidoglycan-associated protein
MKKIGMLFFVITMVAFVNAVQAEVRAGGLPEISADSRIKDCSCPPCCQEEMIISLNVRFDTGKAVISKKYNNDIKTVATFMKIDPSIKVEIQGYTDNVGNDDYNQKLSEKRAKSVRQYLIDKFGIDGSRLKAIGYGKNKPIVSNDTEENRQKNRRVQALIKTTMVANKTVKMPAKDSKK